MTRSIKWSPDAEVKKKSGGKTALIDRSGKKSKNDCEITPSY